MKLFYNKKCQKSHFVRRKCIHVREKIFKLQPIKNEEEKFKKRENLGGEYNCCSSPPHYL